MLGDITAHEKMYFQDKNNLWSDTLTVTELAPVNDRQRTNEIQRCHGRSPPQPLLRGGQLQPWIRSIGLGPVKLRMTSGTEVARPLWAPAAMSDHPHGGQVSLPWPELGPEGPHAFCCAALKRVQTFRNFPLNDITFIIWIICCCPCSKLFKTSPYFLVKLLGRIRKRHFNYMNESCASLLQSNLGNWDPQPNNPKLTKVNKKS